MRTIYKFLILSLILISCEKKKYKYIIEGKIYIPTSGNNPLHEKTWYADTIFYDDDVLYYFEKDGSKVLIYPPFTIYTNE